jgi:membrane protein YdbS with pleckstrin-like domain
VTEGGQVTKDPGAAEVRPTLRAPALRVSRRAIGYWTLRAGIGWLVLIGGTLGVYLLIGQPRWLLVTVIILAVLAAGHLLVMPRWRYRVHRWEATREAVYTQSGWFNQERRIAPISRIQTVDSQRGPLEQVFGLANVTVTTASAAGPLKIHGLGLGDAQQLVDLLTRQAQTDTGDAT